MPDHYDRAVCAAELRVRAEILEKISDGWRPTKEYEVPNTQPDEPVAKNCTISDPISNRRMRNPHLKVRPEILLISFPRDGGIFGAMRGDSSGDSRPRAVDGVIPGRTGRVVMETMAVWVCLFRIYIVCDRHGGGNLCEGCETRGSVTNCDTRTVKEDEERTKTEIGFGIGL